MNAEQMWNAYSTANNIEADYGVWTPGPDSDKLAQLILNGTQTATTSVCLMLVVYMAPFPKQGEFWVVLDSNDEAVCIIQSTKIYIIPFSQVTEEHAWKEGEGDRSLAYWRQVHRERFTVELIDNGFSFWEDIQVLCEEFTKVYP